FRSYESAEVDLAPGVSAFIGPNGQGKTNLVEAVDYVATQSSHRVATDQPLVRVGAEQAIVRAAVQRDSRQAFIELQINPGRANRARLNRGDVPRPRDVVGILRTVVFSPDDLDLVKGDPGARRRFLDDLLVARQPRFAGVRSDYDRVLRQRSALLKTAGRRGVGRHDTGALATLDVWDAHLARTGSELLAARLELVDSLSPHVAKHYDDVAQAVPKPGGGNDASLTYQPSFELDTASDRGELVELLLAEVARRRDEELDRGVTLVGPHRDDLLLSLGSLPTRGYSSHGESWSFALALKLAALELLRADGDDPVLILDDVFAELDDLRRGRLAALVAQTEQVLVTAAVPDDVPADLVDQRFDVRDGSVTRV
ncbi:MAG: DNA replication/repair protein RecF, partial [Propionibacteriales bacterium]|nr:DNA replication/repair protein RecF [Propionibacteriales bacterium]